MNPYIQSIFFMLTNLFKGSLKYRYGKVWIFLYCVTFLVILPILCRNLRFSWYFFLTSKTSALALEDLKLDNNARLREAERFLRETRISPDVYTRVSVDIAITVITVSRNRHVIDTYEPKFLTQVIHKYLQMKEDMKVQFSPLRITLSVCNVDRDPVGYKEAGFISKYVNTFQRYNKTSFPMNHYLENEKQDYVFCLNHTLKQHPTSKFVLLVEDDALPADNLMSILKYVVFSPRIEAESSSLAYVKLFHPERLLNYNVGYYHGYLELVFSSVILGTLLYIILHNVMCIHTTANKYYIVCIVYAMLAQLSIGRPYVEELRRYFPPYLYTLVQAPSCCTPAMLFTASSAASMVTHLSTITCGNGYGKDSAMETVVEKLDLTSLYTLPNAFSHIGFYSALRDNVVDPFVV